MPRAGRQAFLFEKCTELGAWAIWPIVSEHAVVRPRASQVSRWRRTAIEACKQCGRAWLPRIDEPACFDTTLPRFDVLAALDHHADGLRMSELSSWLKVSNGNITGIVDRLVEDGLVVRVPVEGDRRAMLVRLTRKGESEFAKMAKVHAGWVDELLAELSQQEAAQLMSLLDKAAKSSGGKS
jgi:DNA-binding MarR family transcriptional regulator